MAERALVIVPTYNERENIARLIDTILAQDRRLEILVVDDGSPDGTGEIVDGLRQLNNRVHLLSRARKLGLGTAYIAGFRWALERGFDYVFEMDADFSHDPAHLPEFLRAIQDADLVLGSRYRDGKVTVVNWPIGRLLLSYFANVYACGHRLAGVGRDRRGQCFEEECCKPLTWIVFIRMDTPSRSR